MAPRVLTKQIVAATAKASRLRPRDVISPPTRPASRWRQRAIYLCREYRPDLSFPHLGTIFDCDHTTGVHAVKRVKHRLGASPAEAAALAAIRQQLSADLAP